MPYVFTIETHDLDTITASAVLAVVSATRTSIENHCNVQMITEARLTHTVARHTSFPFCHRSRKSRRTSALAPFTMT